RERRGRHPGPTRRRPGPRRRRDRQPGRRRPRPSARRHDLGQRGPRQRPRGHRRPRLPRARRRRQPRAALPGGIRMSLTGRLRGAVLATVALLLASAPRSARAVCSATGGCPDLVSACCGATSCTLDGTITVTDDTCVLSFGSRDITLSGVLDAGEHVLTITAGSLHITGRLSASGSGGLIRVQPPPGGTLGRGGVPGLSLTDRGRIDLSGTNGATLIVVADGAVELR